MKKIRQKDPEKVWAEFKEEQNLTDDQINQFKKYYEILDEWNQKINLTAIKDLSGVVRQHFIDSMALTKFKDLKKIKSIADIGAGAGFPAIPLKILYPHLAVLLIETNHKKQEFLHFLLEELDLKDVEICEIDWRTFLRTTKGDIDLFVSRAAMDEVELCRMFKANSDYKNAELVYWVTEMWEPEKKVEKYLQDLKEYALGKKIRKLSFWKNI
ncbi:MAG: 16S rRNA (guanine(527)-N(7))-methyltransferase RsmG [bacterium]